jgi:DNA cross-link repair 1C protein
MSTFNGIVKEFPDIRIDFFRRHASLKPPLACFLSHIHSDHLQGLDSPVLPFVYCSAATKRLLLRMEKYPHRINFAKGILEARKQTYRHLKKVLKALPLQTPTVIELTPKSTIRVTLFDANHCPGAVMFLIEGDGKAILYTGDIRSESWLINSLIRHHTMIPYTLGERTLDCLYMDTTFAAKVDIYADFPSKAHGLAELISKAEQYPPETIFYFRAWTLGYEDAWLALSSLLSSRIHVDNYQTRLYSGLLEDQGERISVQEAGALVGFAAGNHHQEGCLTDDPAVPVRIHSCEPGTACHAKLSKRPDIVWITPIISRTPDGTEMYEIGAGGGGGDLYQTPELDITDPGVFQTLQALCAESLTDPAMLDKALFALEKVALSGTNRVSLDGMGINLDSSADITLHDFVALLSSSRSSHQPNIPTTTTKLTTTLRFPYSRHSSYNELRELVAAFKPRDICPCTVDLDTWNDDVSMEVLFGDLCLGHVWIYDAENRSMAAERRELLAAMSNKKRKRGINDDGETQRSQDVSEDTFETAETGRDQDQNSKFVQANNNQGNHNTTNNQLPPSRKARESNTLREHAPPTARTTDATEQPPRDETLDTPARRLKAIEAAFHSLKDAKDTSTTQDPGPNVSERGPSLEDTTIPEIVPAIASTAPPNENPDQHENDDQDQHEENVNATETQHSSISLSLSAFESQPLSHSPSPPPPQTAPSSTSKSPRLQARISAYHAAKASLAGDCRGWEELGIRSTGYVGHGEEEVEL